jgi:uncharacterized protein (DUF1684 family)
MNDLKEFRAAKDEFFAHSHQSPIPHHRQRGFSGLTYFDEAPELVFDLPLDRSTAGGEITIQTSDGQQRRYVDAGTVAFEVNGESVRLTLYSTPGHGHGFFLPFRDATSGKETYGAGRYLDLDREGDDGTIRIDFNLAYNPFCAYDDVYSCPLPPVSNWLPVPIEAGHRPSARSRRKPPASSTATPSCSALASLEPADSPATT